MDGFDESFDSTRLNKRHSPKLMRPPSKMVCVCVLVVVVVEWQEVSV